MNYEYSIVEYMSGHSGYKCGYCKSKDTNYSHGMWGHKVSVEDYQSLIDRGWRRSGKYCYKPTMDKTCCPQYTIKCDALNFKLSKSQKKVLKRMHAYLSYGKEPSIQKDNISSESSGFEIDLSEQPKHSVGKDISAERLAMTQLKVVKKEEMKSCNQIISRNLQDDQDISRPVIVNDNRSAKESTIRKGKKNMQIKPGDGRDPSKPTLKKAKILRLERRAAKSVSEGIEDMTNSAKSARGLQNSQEPKSLEDFIDAPLPDSPAHRLELRLVEVNRKDARFLRTYKLSHGVFQSYQMAIHQDSLKECSENQFENFLVDGPLTPWKEYSSPGPPCGYGPFHQQYWLDGQLIAVGVIDILPSCVSSVYLYFDPKFSFLSLGTYAALREIAFTRELHRSAPKLKWYYMGFYIHSCQKMRYKGNFCPSFLLCPETYTWVDIEKCVEKLDRSKYARLNTESNLIEELVVNMVMCLHNGRALSYGALKAKGRRNDEDEAKEYLRLTGAKAGYSLLLFRE